MHMIPQKKREWTDFSISEWNRLNNLAGTYEREFRQAWLQTIVQNKRPHSDVIENIITDCVVVTAMTTSRIYGLTFNYESPIYNRLVNKLTSRYMQVIENDTAKVKVKEILPAGLSLSDRRERLDTFGLDANGAVRIERMRQRGEDSDSIKQARFHMSVQRGNLVSITEVNRIVNWTIETLCIDNLRVSKSDLSDLSDVWFFEDSVPSNITSIAGLPKRAKKEIITRRDDRVCNYCDPLDGMKVKIGEVFDTDYGFFYSPPFHPRCRCFIGVSL